MKFFSIAFDTIIWRFYLLMAVTVIPFLLGVYGLALLAVPVFLSIMLGVSFTKQKGNSQTKEKQLDTSLLTTYKATA